MNSVKGEVEGKGVENAPNTNEKWMTNKKKLWAIAIVVLILLAGTFSFFFVTKVRFTTTTFRYEVRIYTEQDIDYTVIVPFPNITADVNHWQEYILDSISNPDSAELELVETEHGTGLKIVSNRSVNLEIDRKISIPVDGVTMEESNETSIREGEFEYWIYSKSNQNTNSNFTVRLNMRKYTSSAPIMGFRTGGGIEVRIDSYGYYGTTSSIDVGWEKYWGNKGYPVG